MFGIKTRVMKYVNSRYGYFAELTGVRISPVGYFCTASCPMCWRMNISTKEIKTAVRDEAKRLTLQEYKKLFRHLPNTVNSVDVLGRGEPLLFPQIGELFKIIKQNKDYLKNKYCQIVQSNIDISSAGEVLPCCLAYGQYQSSSIRQKSLSQIWREGRLFRLELAQGKFRTFCQTSCNYELATKKGL